MRTPTVIAGRPVVGCIKVNTWPGTHPERVVAITQTDEERFNVHAAGLVDAGTEVWDAHTGTYDLSWSEALAEVVRRTRNGVPG